MGNMLYEVIRTEEFNDWLNGLKDLVIITRITNRIKRIKEGNLGDYKSIGDRVSELRLQFGAGYRIYFTLRENVIIILLCGGDKSTQSRDIERAKQMAGEVATWL